MKVIRATLQRRLPVGPQKAFLVLRRALRLPLVLFGDGLLRLRVGPDAPRKYQLLFVRPKDIRLNHIGRISAMARFPDRFPGTVAGGDWDCLEAINPDCIRILTAVEKRIIQGLSWRETGEVDRMLSLVARHGSSDFCRSLEDIEWRNHNLDTLIAFVRSTRTLLSRRELSAVRFREMGGISAVVARDGRLILAYAGTHRLAIAQVLDVPVIPVAITLVHSECLDNGIWQTLVARSHRLEKERATLLAHAAHCAEVENEAERASK